ncbi:MAG: Aminodeoxychorismate synthase component 1, partial [Candidatus Hydrogenedentota bacterium]
LCNERGELTETCIGNIVLTLDGMDYTPPVECGLLAGCHREALISAGKLHLRVLYASDIEQAERMAVINSVRGRIEATLA